MGMMDFWKKPEAKRPFVETAFACKRGNLTIRGTEYRPEGENLPVAVVCHGFMAWQDAVRHYAQLHIIQGGAHGFGKKHDAIAIAHLRSFAGRNEK